MANVDAMTLLEAWEHGLGQQPLQRTLMLLAAAAPERSAEEWVSASLGDRDARLFALREQLFGEHIEVTAPCAQCGVLLQAEFSTREACESSATSRISSALVVAVDDYTVRFRLPTSRDLREAIAPGVADARARLLASCLEDVSRGGAPVAAAELPPPVTDALLEAMRRSDPLADLEIDVSCESCGHERPIAFDIAEHLWGDIAECAERLLEEVHLLASTYHWAERDILRLSSARRRRYLDMVGA
jgi:hypothetical protein